MADKPKHSGRTLFSLGLGYLIDQGEAQAMGVLSPILQMVFGISLGQIGLMETLVKHRPWASYHPFFKWYLVFPSVKLA